MRLEEVLEKSGKRIQELVASVDQFTATEAVTHESIIDGGLPRVRSDSSSIILFPSRKTGSAC